MTDIRLGYVGLGNMGTPMARRLVGWPGGLVVYDVRAEATASFVDAGTEIAGDLARRRERRRHQRDGAR